MISNAVGSAGVAQLVEQLICNQQVGGSNPSTSSKILYGGVPERSNGADCKSVVTDFGGSNPPSPTKTKKHASACFFVLVGGLFPGLRPGKRVPPTGGVIEIPRGEPGKVPPADTPLLRAAFGLSEIGARPRGAGLRRGYAGQGDGDLENRMPDNKNLVDSVII